MLGGEQAIPLTVTSASKEDSNLPLLGVHLSYFDTFISECGGREKLLDFTTAQVCDVFIKPSTQSSQSLCDSLALAPSTAEIVGRATWFISHCWQYTFLDVVDAITTFFNDQETAETEPIVWFDLFSLPQHGRSKIAADWLQTTFMDTISAVHNVLMILTPWNAPITLTRAWCVYELYACVATKTNFHIALPPSEASTFRSSLLDDPDIFYQTISSVRSENSKATEPEDLAAIRKAIQQEVGFPSLDRMILSLLFDWMVRSLQSRLQSIEKAGDKVQHAQWLSSLGRLYEDQGLYDKAQPLYTESLETRRSVLGEDHPLVLTSMSNLARLHHHQGDYQPAEKLYIECIDGRRQVLPENHEDTFAALGNLAALYDDMGQPEKAEPLYLDILNNRALGEDDTCRLSMMNNLATLYHTQKQFEKAEPLYVDCLARRRRVLGPDHPDTLSTVNNLASLQDDLGRGWQAEKLYLECLARRRAMLGDDHPDTLASTSALAVLYGDHGEYEKAEPLYLDCLERRTRVLGKDHRRTILTMYNLGTMYDRQGNREQAERVYLQAMERSRRALGDQHPYTLASAEGLARVRKVYGGTLAGEQTGLPGCAVQ
ncbi:Kinesin light chain 3 [Rhizophlyctis rosea]|nr:Kinesin light chain 3 [Rhizophlyctis rosea]